MSQSIDKKVVEMAFENSNFDKNVASSVSMIDKLKQSLNFSGAGKSFDGITTASNKVNLAGLSQAIESVNNRFSLLGIAATTTLVNIVNSAVNAGKQIAKALTIDPIKMGFEEYELKLNSVQTIMAGTGEDLQTVTKYLNELNTYADRTIYSFSDMTQNIGKFTNAGVSLDQSVKAIQGVANVAAVSGANAQEASRAMYNFAQALSSGYIKLIDWKSIELANMGTVEFKNQLLDAAVAAGTLTKTTDGMFKTVKGNTLSATRGFNEALTDQWLTTEVLVSTLNKYSDTTTDIGKKATAAAQDVKTFTQLYDTLKESAQSGWAQTWEFIIGDFNEAKKFLTDFNNWFGSILSASADARNQMLGGWKDLGGRTKLIEAFQNVLNAIVTTINPIKQGMEEIFPKLTAERLYSITENLATFTKSLIASQPVIDNIKRISKGFFAALDIGRMAVSALVKNLIKLISSFSQTGSSILDGIGSLSDFVVRLRDSIKSSDTFNKFFSGIVDVIQPAIAGIIGFFKSLFDGFKSTEKVTKSDSLSNFLTVLGEKLEGFGAIGKTLSKVFGFISKFAEKIGPIVRLIATKAGELFNSLFDAMTRGLDNLDTGKILDLINKGLTGGVLLSLKGFVDQGKKIVGGGLFTSILLSIKNFIDNGGNVFKNVSGILDSVKGSLEAYQKTLKSNTLLKIAAAIGILALSIIALSFVNPDKLATATAAIAALFAGLITTLDVFDKSTGGGKKMLVMTASLLGISVALLIMAGVITILSKLDPKAAVVGTLTIASVLGMLVMFQQYSGGKIAGAATGLLALSVGLLGLSVAIKVLGNLKPEILVQGLLGMAAALTTVGIAMSVMGGNISGAGVILLAAGAILLLAFAFKTMADLSLEQIGIGLLAIAGIFTILGIAGAVLTPVIPTIGLLALSILAIGAAVLVAGAGVLAFGVGIGLVATGLLALGAISSTAIAGISLLIAGLATLLPTLARFAVKAIDALFEQLAKSAPNIIKSVLTIALDILKNLSTLLPEVVNTVLDFITMLLSSLSEKLPTIIQAGYDIVLALLQGIADNIGQIVNVSADIITAYLDAIAERLPDIIDSGWNLIISFIDGMKNSVQDHLPELIQSSIELGAAIVEGVISGLGGGREIAVDTIKRLGQNLIDNFKALLGIRSPSSVFAELALNIIQGLVNGIIDNIALVIRSIITLGNRIIDTANNKITGMYDVGKNLVQGLANGIGDYISTAVNSAATVAQDVLNKISSVFDEHSPARTTFESGKNVVFGLANGITQFAGTAVAATEDLGNQTLAAFNSVVGQISDTMNSNMDFNPTITPVIDLTNISSGTKTIDQLLSNKNLNLSVSASKANIVAQNQTRQELVTEGAAAPTQGSNVSFVQNNYSPKALSRYDIYRQTELQLRQIQEATGA